MINDDLLKFRSAMMRDDFDSADVVALSFKEAAPRLSLFLQQCIWHERDGWAHYEEVPVRGPNPALSQSMATLKSELAFRSGNKSVSSKWVLSDHNTELLLGRDWSENANCLHLRANLANSFGLKSLFKRSAQALAKKTKIGPKEVPQLRQAYTKLFSCMVDERCLNNYCDFLTDWASKLRHTFPIDFGKAFERLRKEKGSQVEVIISSCFAKLLESPDTQSHVINQIVIALGRHSANLDMATRLGHEALIRFADDPHLNFWTARNDISAVNLEAHRDLADRLEIASQGGDTDLFARSAYFLSFTEVGADKFAKILANALRKTDHTSRVEFPSVVTEIKPNELGLALCSKFFFNHGIGHVLLNTLGHFSDYGISPKLISVSAENMSDSYSKELIERADAYYEIPPSQFAKVPGLMSSMSPDLFVDIDGYMTPVVQEVAKMRPAPLNVYWIGHGGRLGLSYYDYVVGDQFVTPTHEAKFFPEKEIRLPTSFVTSGVFEFDREAKRAEFGLPEGKFIFNCFNNFQKLSPIFFAALERIASQVPNAVFWFNSGSSGPEVHAMVRNRLIGIGLSESQIHFAQRVEPKSKHYDRLALSDLGLDTFTVNTSSGALDNMWAEVPTLTMPGDNYYNRICGSFNRAIGLEELNTGSLDEYIAKAVFLAENPGELARIRALIADRKDASSLFNPEKFAEEFAAGMWAAMERVWAGLPPEHIDVEI